MIDHAGVVSTRGFLGHLDLNVSDPVAFDVAEPPTTYDYAPGYYAVAFDDPDGIRLEVVYDPTTNPKDRR